MGILENVKKEVKEELKQAEKKGVGLLDVVSEKLISRKFMVWIIATIFVGLGKIDPENWATITEVYIGAQGISDLATRWKGIGK
jgi:hypothetical protein